MATFYSAQFVFRPWRLVTCLYRICTYGPRTALELGLTNIVRVKLRALRKRFALGRHALQDQTHDRSAA
jgi:hypothetical protein